MADILDIKQVPPDPNTGIMPKRVYNPLNEEFWFAWDGIDYSIPAKSSKDFPEFLAYHAAKHLAQRIVYTGFALKIAEEAEGQITPDTAKSVPLSHVKEVQEALLSTLGEAEKVSKKYEIVSKAGIEYPSLEGEVVFKKPPEKTVKEKRLENLAKARAAKKAKKK